ncbi:MAG: MnhB domain-containing protein [Lachnospiraceae bacterium]|nr:MnhB domain-containing protein [Lachnospiraceae bacterium]
MSKKRSDYNRTLWSKIENFVNGGDSLSDFQEEILQKQEMAESTSIKEEGFMEDYLSKQQKEDELLLLQKYENWPQKRGIVLFHRIYVVLSVIIGGSIMVLLLMTVSYLPEFGAPDNPVNNEVAARYIENGVQETGAVNIVTGLILNYRGFDTMGETHVLFIAASCVMILLFVAEGKQKDVADADDRRYEPKNDVILQKVAAVLVPSVFIFGIYVILNGHLSPGGGFSGGAMLGAGLILYVSAFGFKKTEQFFNETVYKVAKISALCFYVCSLSYYFYTGANGINNGIPLGIPGKILSSGLILFINIFVGTEVACTMYAFYALFRKGGL